MAEKEYIERNGLLEWAREFYPEQKVFASAVINAPTADVQEVVRCKDCRSRNRHGECCFFGIDLGDNGFCSEGERCKNG